MSDFSAIRSVCLSPGSSTSWGSMWLTVQEHSVFSFKVLLRFVDILPFSIYSTCPSKMIVTFYQVNLYKEMRNTKTVNFGACIHLFTVFHKLLNLTDHSNKQGYIFLQIPCFLGWETFQPKFKLGKKWRKKQYKCVHEMGKKFNK